MAELLALWRFLQEAGGVSQLLILAVLFYIWRNDLKHLSADLVEVKKMLMTHLQWHSEQVRHDGP